MNKTIDFCRVGVNEVCCAICEEQFKDGDRVFEVRDGTWNDDGPNFDPDPDHHHSTAWVHASCMNDGPDMEDLKDRVLSRLFSDEFLDKRFPDAGISLEDPPTCEVCGSPPPPDGDHPIGVCLDCYNETGEDHYFCTAHLHDRPGGGYSCPKH